MKRNILAASLLIILFSLASFAQGLSGNLPEKIDLIFSLEADPSVEDVGFNNPKSSWKSSYEIYIADFGELEKLGKCGLIEGRSIKTCSNLTDKKLDKKIRKSAHRISKGKFSQNQLAKEENRKLFRTINLTTKAFEIFQEAAKVYEKNPVLIIYINSKISTKNSAGAKLKKKYNTEGYYWLKIYNADKSVQYQNLSKVTFKLEILKNQDNSLGIKVGYIQFG